MMRKYWLLALFGYVALLGASVWLGGLNQDEGWYVYAAQLVSEGRLPWRDFFFTQGPVMPVVYSFFRGAWEAGGLLGARLLTAGFGLVALVFLVALARRLAPEERRGEAAVVAFLLLGNNLYHLYYTAIPKTYALTAAFVAVGFYLAVRALELRAAESPRRVSSGVLLAAAGLSFAFAAGARISAGALLASVGLTLLVAFRRCGWSFLWFALGGAAGLVLVYGIPLLDAKTLAGFVAAQQYHAAREGFDVYLVVGSVSRLVRWYLPVFILAGLGVFLPRARTETEPSAAFASRLVLIGFLAVFAVQILAPNPYDDYQVPVMGLFAAWAAAGFARTVFPAHALIAFGLAWGCSFGSPLLEKWTTNGQDRFWPLKKRLPELAQLRETAREINALDPGGKTLLTQDLYLAIETRRHVPEGLEMGPFSKLDDAAWRALIESAPAPVAALSGYTFAVEPPRCARRPVDQQLEYWQLLKKNYNIAFREEDFGQNATTLLVLTRKPGAGKDQP